MRPGVWGASLDLTDAYFHVPIAKETESGYGLFGRTRFLIQGPSLRPVTSPMAVYHNSQRTGQGTPVHGHSRQDVPGRLVSASRLAGAVRETHGDNNTVKPLYSDLENVEKNRSL